MKRKNDFYCILLFLLAGFATLAFEVKASNTVSVFGLENSIIANKSSDKYICNPACYFYNWGYIKTNNVFSLYEEGKTGKWYVVDAYGNRAWVYKTSNNRDFRYQFYMSGYYYFN